MLLKNSLTDKQQQHFVKYLRLYIGTSFIPFYFYKAAMSGF